MYLQSTLLPHPPVYPPAPVDGCERRYRLWYHAETQVRARTAAHSPGGRAKPLNIAAEAWWTRADTVGACPAVGWGRPVSSNLRNRAQPHSSTARGDGGRQA